MTTKQFKRIKVSKATRARVERRSATLYTPRRRDFNQAKNPLLRAFQKALVWSVIL